MPSHSCSQTSSIKILPLHGNGPDSEIMAEKKMKQCNIRDSISLTSGLAFNMLMCPNEVEFITCHKEAPISSELEKVEQAHNHATGEGEGIYREMDNRITASNDKAFMTSKPGVQTAIEKEVTDYLPHAMLAKQLPKLPDGYWYHKRPGELPGVPITDAAVRVKDVESLVVKMRPMAPEEREKAIKQLLQETTLGLFDALINRNHTNLRDVQATLGSLQWFQMFVPNSS